MSTSVVLVLKYGSYCSFKEFNLGMSYCTLVQFVCSRWDLLRANNIAMSYTFAPFGNFSVKDDVDVASMFLMVKQCSIERIEVFVKQKHASLSMSSSSYSSTVTSSSALTVFEVEPSTQMVIAPLNPVSSVDGTKKSLLSSHWINLIADVGQVFRGGRSEFRLCLAKFAYQVGFRFQFTENDRTRVTALCKLRASKNCRWRIHATVQSETKYCIIRTYEKNHTCESAFSAAKKIRMSVKIVADLIVDETRAIPDINPHYVMFEAKKKYGIEIDYNTAWRALESSKDTVFGDDAICYSYLKTYFGEAQRLNPDSVFDVEVDGKKNSFERCFFSFGACLDGFKFCRPLLFLDGTFMKGRYKGILLSAIAKDARNGIYPVAFAIVDEENDSNWEYFLSQLRCCIGTNRVLTFVSDRQHGILKGVANVFPDCNHSFCLNHLEDNLRAKLTGLGSSFRDALVNQFIACAYECSKEIFHEKLEKFKTDGGKNVTVFLSDLPFKNWTNAYFEGCRYGELYSNVVESFNGKMKKFQDLPVTEMVDSIKGYVMDKICDRALKSRFWTTKLPPTMEKIISDFVHNGRTWNLRRASPAVFEVHSDPPQVVDLISRTCTCREWQLKVFPCCHVAVVFMNIPEEERYEYIDPFYYTSTYCSTYSFSIYPFYVDFKRVVQPGVGPPSRQTRRGRPRKKRIPSRGEIIKNKIKCGRCKEIGHHNRKSCNKVI